MTLRNPFKSQFNRFGGDGGERGTKPKKGVTLGRENFIYFLFLFLIVYICFFGFHEILKNKNTKDHFQHMCYNTILHQVITSA